MMNPIGSTSHSARKGIGGLVSGLNTDELVQGLTESTRNKIIKSEQDKQKISWKTDSFRAISSKLIALSDKYMSFSSSTNLLSNSFFTGSTINTIGANSNFFTATGDLSAAKGLSITEIVSLAKTANYNSTNPASNGKITTDDITLGDKDISNIAGETLNIRYDGVLYNVKIDKSLSPNATESEIVDALNKALQDVSISGGQKLSDKLSFSLDTDKVKLSSVDSTDTNTFILVGGSGKSIDSLGLKVGTSGTGNMDILGATLDKAKFKDTYSLNDTLKDQSLTFTFNGISKKVSFGSGPFNSVADIGAGLQQEMNKAFGSGNISVITNGNKLEFSTSNTNSLSLIDTSNNMILGEKGFLGNIKGSSNKLNLNQSLANNNLSIPVTSDGIITVNGKDVAYKSTDSLNDVINRINKDTDIGVTIKYMETSNSFSITASNSGSMGKIDITDKTGNLSSALFGGNISNVSGEDASIKFKVGNGAEQTITRPNNAFDIDGVVIKITDKATVGVLSEAVRFDGSANTDEIVSTVKSMIDSYNEIIELVNNELNTRPNRNYQPLTDSQRKEMTEQQIKDWEDQAKAGLLFGDPDLRALSTELRFAFSFGAGGIGQVLDIGISTSSAYKDNGKIVFDEKKFKKALEENPDDIRKMFSASENKDPSLSNEERANSAGIITKVKKIADKYASTVGEKGILIKTAGLKDSSAANESVLFRQIQRIEQTIIGLKRSLKIEEDRYYKQFTTLEQYMSQMNAQSSWLAGQF